MKNSDGPHKINMMIGCNVCVIDNGQSPCLAAQMIFFSWGHTFTQELHFLFSRLVKI